MEVYPRLSLESLELTGNGTQQRLSGWLGNIGGDQDGHNFKCNDRAAGLDGRLSQENLGLMQQQVSSPGITVGAGREIVAYQGRR